MTKAQRPPKPKPMPHTPEPDRYERMVYRRCGRSGIKLPVVSLGLWHNFGADSPHENKRAMCRTAFDHGITHFDLANNYGPLPGSAEEAFGEILKTDFASYRDELIISSKAGYDMWPGPYEEWRSRKYVIASCDQSLARMGLDYVDIFFPTASTLTPRSKRRWARWIVSYGLVVRSTPVSRATTPNARARR